jgi:hypothetical protein
MSGHSLTPGDVHVCTSLSAFLEPEVPPCSGLPPTAPSSCGWVPIDVVLCVEKAVRPLHTEDMPMGTQPQEEGVVGGESPRVGMKP